MKANKSAADKIRVATAEALARRLNEINVRYAVVNGLYGYPERIGRDLDIVMLPQDALRALPLMFELKKEFGWDFLFGRWSYYGTWQIFFASLAEQKRLTWLEVDLMTANRNLVVGIAPLGDIKMLVDKTEKRGPFKINAGGYYLKAYFRPIFYGDLQRFQQKYVLRPPEPGQETKISADLLGPTLFKEYISHVSTSSLDELEEWIPQLRWKLNLRFARRHPLSALKNFLWTRAVRPLALWLFNPGMVVAIVGPDGVGKSSSIREAQRYLNGLFDIKVRHWRPGVLPAPSKLVGKKQSVSLSPNRIKPSWIEHWLRILYYWADYIVGYMIRDRFVPKSVIQLVLYDRHAIDTAVDPLRYRLRSRAGTTFLYKFIPKPYIIFINDDATRIYERKKELSLEEIELQLSTWKKLVKSGEVDSVVKAGESPSETGRKIAEEVLKFASRRFDLGKWVHNIGSEDSSIETLPESLGIRLAEGSATHVLLRLPDGRAYLLPIQSTNAFRRALTLYSAQSFKGLVGKAALNFFSRFNLPLPGVLRVELKEEKNSLFQTAREIFGRNDLVFGISLGTPGPHRKPVVQVLSKAGNVLGYIKVGWNEPTKKLVRNEAEKLRYLEGKVLPFITPHILFEGKEHDRFLLVQSTPFDQFIPASTKWDAIYEQALSGLAPLKSKTLYLEESAFWKSIKERASLVRESYLHDNLIKFMDEILRKLGDKKIPFHLAHGDFTPWNISVMNRKPYLFDWEYAMDEAPAGYDLFHWAFQTEYLVYHKKPHEIINSLGEISTQVTAYWNAIGLQAASHDLFILYLIDRLAAGITDDSTRLVLLTLLNFQLMD